jgi:ribose-phosphate pyrophosphokinase
LMNFSDQELLLYNCLDASLEAKVEHITIFELNLGQARSDRPKGRGSCNLRTFFRNLTANGADHLFFYQIHSNRSLIGVDLTKTSYDNLSGESILKKFILRNHVCSTDYFLNTVQKEWVFSSVDAGGKQFAAHFSRVFNVPMLVVDKRRNALTNKIEEITILKAENLSIEGKVVFIVDDMIDSGGSIVDVCMKYKELGAKEINIAVFYGIFSPPAEEILNELRSKKALNKLIITDLVRHNEDFYKRNPFIEVVETSYTTARVIQRTNQGSSLEKYFKEFDALEYLKTKVEPEMNNNLFRKF